MIHKIKQACALHHWLVLHVSVATLSIVTKKY